MLSSSMAHGPLAMVHSWCGLHAIGTSVPCTRPRCIAPGARTSSTRYVPDVPARCCCSSAATSSCSSISANDATWFRHLVPVSTASSRAAASTSSSKYVPASCSTAAAGRAIVPASTARCMAPASSCSSNCCCNSTCC